MCKMSSYSGSEEEKLDLFYLAMEERILLLISEEEEEEEDRMMKTGKEILLQSNNCFVNQLQPRKQWRKGYCEIQNIERKIKPWIYEYNARNNGGKRVPEISGRRGTGVFLPNSLSLVAVDRKQ
ncbi:hypothetical protein MA16_Dca007451 [Dendrobium catenatum]|uniref:Uncharacterized protein n=1 Tax=Dendrobium catenatum TaxID=906689 RepID=A0A2I0WAQ2_9ASPA|nr:hypothetical protein MA16_Dca007451 [Dendrobium catenatum]